MRKTANSEQLLHTLRAYGFTGIDELTLKLLQEWLQTYPDGWPALALVEAVYQGRYKLLSVQQILRCWQRCGEPRTHFDWSFQQQVLAQDWQPLIPSIPTPEPIVVSLPQPLGWQPVVERLRELVGAA